jgi:hypothetical protein
MAAQRCPFIVTLDLADELLARYGHLHQDRQAAANNLALGREAAIRAHEMLTCEPAVSAYGTLTCPLDGVIHEALKYGLGTFSLAGWAIPVAELHGETREAIGQML